MQSIRRVSFFLIFLLSFSQYSQYSWANESALGYTHILPSPFTLRAGQLVYGSYVAFGVTDFLQVGTNLYRDFQKVYNADAKVSIYRDPTWAGALTLGFESFSLRDVDSSNPDLDVTTWRPGAVAGVSLSSAVAWYFGGTLRFSDVSFDEGSIQTSSSLRGATVGSDLSWKYGSSTDRGSNALTLGVSYDATYELFGIGASHHWPGFQLGVHVYPNADSDRYLPIISGGGSVDL